ncbi:MAG TPA: hypothetical protein VGM69_27435 [Chloroflexota bacterium]|jgi:hypothetical protein
MNHLPGHQRARIILPAGIARRMCVLAREEWGDESEERAGWGVSRVRMWLGGTAAHRRESRGDQRPFGAFSVRWGTPQPSLAVIEKIEWDPRQGASEEEIRHAVDHLAGWPVATLDRTRP